MEAVLINILAARLLVMLTRTLSWEPTTVSSSFFSSSTQKTYWRDISRERISPYTCSPTKEPVKYSVQN